MDDASDELACIVDVVPAPVVSEYVERVLVTIGAGILPVAVTITGVVSQRFEQVTIDVNFRKHACESHRFNYLSGHEIVAICSQVGSDRQSFLRRSKC